MPISFSTLLLQRSRCSFEDQLSLFPLIETLVTLQNICQNYGALALEDFIWGQNKHTLNQTLTSAQYRTLHFILALVLDGRDPKVITEIALTYMSKRKKGLLLLQDMLILEGAICYVYRHSLHDTRSFLHRLLDAPLYHPDTAAQLWLKAQEPHSQL